MIHAPEVMPLLMTACPSFAVPWEAYRAEPSFDDELLYVHLGEFARHLVTLWREGQTSELTLAFEAVERLHVEGDDYVREAATIGILEDVQNNAGRERIDPEVFRPFLGTRSAQWWEGLNRFWSGESPRVEE